MSKRPSIEERDNKRPVNAFFTGEQANQQASKKVKKQASNDYTKKTYYLTDRIIKAINFYSAFEDIDKSEIVRAALESHIPKKYFDMISE